MAALQKESMMEEDESTVLFLFPQWTVIMVEVLHAPSGDISLFLVTPLVEDKQEHLRPPRVDPSH